METRQRQVLESFLRVRTFVIEHPATGVLTYASARATLDDVVEKVRELASREYRGREMSRAEVQRQKEQVAVVLDHHIRPIVTIARAQIEPTSDVGLPAGLRMPKVPLNASRALTVSDGMIEAARPFEAVFVANGLPADFLAQFQAARDELERLGGGRAVQVGAHMAARTSLPVQLLRGRRAVERLDAIVRASYRRNPGVLAAWRSVKRVQKAPGGSGARGGTTVTPSTEANGASAPASEASAPSAAPAVASPLPQAA